MRTCVLAPLLLLTMSHAAAAQNSNPCAVDGPAAGSRPNGSTQVTALRRVAKPNLTGSVKCPIVEAVLISSKLESRCEEERCLSTAPTIEAFLPVLKFDKSRFVPTSPARMTVSVCFAAGAQKDCPTGALQTYLMNSDYETLPPGAEWGQLIREQPQCLVLRWDDGSVSTTFVLKRRLDVPATCKFR